MTIPKILVLSGSRADLGYLRPVAEALHAAGAEVSIESLANVIEGEDTPAAISQRAGMILSAGGRTLAEANPDLMLVCGDRWEVLAGCIAAVLAGIPIAHLGAGETTTGAYDERFRGAIEALATLRFAMTRRALDRFGPSAILAGCTSCEPPAEIVKGDGTAIIALYPETAGTLKVTAADLAEMTRSRGLSPLVIGANADVGSGRYAGVSLPLEEFHARLVRASVIIGNSSVGIIEAPILGTPSVNIGRRQEGRPQAASVFSCSDDPAHIENALTVALAFGKTRVKSPYYHPGAIGRIVEACLEHLYHR